MAKEHKENMSEIQYHTDIEKLIDILPLRIKSNIKEGMLQDAIEIVLDIGRIPEIRLGNGKILSLGNDNITREDLDYITFQAEPFYPLNLLDTGSCPEFIERNPDVKNILSRFLFLEEQKIVNLTEYTNTDLKFKYGVANLTLLTEYDTNYNELITLLHNYGSILAKEGYSSQALSVLEYAISIGTDISGTYMLCAKIYQENKQWNKLAQLKKEAEKISTSRKDSIVRKLQEFDPCNG